MSPGFKKFLFYFVWVVLLLIGPLTIRRNTPLRLILGDELLIINFLQRFTGLLAFTLLAIQIILGSLMPRLIDKLGGWIFNFHQAEGLWVWGIILLHPAFFALLNYTNSGLLAALLTIIPRFSPSIELWYSFGKFAFLLITTAVLAGYFREKPFLRKHWRKFHILNYFGFAFVAVHSYFSGTDTWTAPFSWLYWVAVLLVATTILLRLNLLRKRSAQILPKPAVPSR